MTLLSWPSILFYCAFSTFVFFQQLHLRDFRGDSEVFRTVLALSVLAGVLTGLAYLIYYGWIVVWWAPLVAFALGVLAAIPGTLFGRMVGAGTMSLLGFVGWPICAFFMFHFVPAHP